MKLNTGSLPIGGREFSFVEDTGTVGLDDRFIGDIAVLAKVEKTAKMVELQATIRVQAQLVCDRCTEEFTKEIVKKYRVVYFFNKDDSGGYPEEEVVILPSDNTIIDLTDDVRQYVLLTIPLKVLCRQDCKGLCQICGTNQNNTTCSCTVSHIDPRWEQLNKLLKQN